MTDDAEGMFGERLARYMKAAGISAKDLHFRTRIPQTTIESYLPPNAKVPRFINGVRIADALGVHPADLVGMKRSVGSPLVLPEPTNEKLVTAEEFAELEKQVVALRALLEPLLAERAEALEQIASGHKPPSGAASPQAGAAPQARPPRSK